MPSHLKALVHARQKRTGESYQAALRHIRAQSETPAIRNQLPPIDDLLRELDVPNAFRIVVGKLPAVGVSADQAVAEEIALRRLQTPVYYASTGSVEMSISIDQHKALVEKGAVDGSKKQMLRTRLSESGTPLDLSHRCERCGRWINSGEREREGACFCGHAYRVAFDLRPRHRWSLRDGSHCLDCGKKFGFREWIGPRQPWHPLNEGQMRCHICQLVVDVATEGHDFLCRVGRRSFVLLDVAPRETWIPSWKVSEVFPETARPPQHLATVDFGTKQVPSEVFEANRTVYDQALEAVRDAYGAGVLAVRPLRLRKPQL